MSEYDFNQNKQTEPGDLEQRLKAYYGPPLPEQSLPPASWHYVRRRLGPQASTRRRFGFRLRFPRKRSRAFVPTVIQEAFVRVASEARIPSTRVMLRCRLTSRVHEPMVQSSWLGRQAIRLTLPPLYAATSMERDELDVLLATGLARSICVRRSIPTLTRFLLIGLMLLAGVALIMSWMYRFPLVGVPVALALWTVVTWRWYANARSVAFHADILMVRWLGRGSACRGLHALAEHSRTPRRRRWGEPSLAERIERVCGTGVEASIRKGSEDGSPKIYSVR